MNAEQLETAQTGLEEKIYEIAKENGLSNENLEPITDGVYDAAKYLASDRKVMWIMKEPYDEMEDGKPAGGGWNIAKDCFGKSDAWANRSWQPIIYSMYGLKHHLLWGEMDWVDQSMAEILQEIAYINVSKMPNMTASNDGYIGKCYQIWKKVLFGQIEIYDPDVMIFAATFKHFYNDMLPDARYFGDISFNGAKAGEAYWWKGRLILSVMHPNNRSIQREAYVNSIINAVNKHLTCR